MCTSHTQPTHREVSAYRVGTVWAWLQPTSPTSSVPVPYQVHGAVMASLVGGARRRGEGGALAKQERGSGVGGQTLSEREPTSEGRTSKGRTSKDRP